MTPPSIPPLRDLYFHVTGACNLRCRHCWQQGREEEKGAEGRLDAGLAPEVFRRVLREGKALGLGSVKLTGGEPFLHPRITDYLEVLRGEGLSVVLETNATLLDEACVEVIRSLKVQDTAVSLDGATAETHDRFRGRSGAFDRALAALDRLARHGLPFQIIMSVHRGNRGEVADMTRLATELGASSLKVNPVQPMGGGKVLADAGECLDVEEVLALSEVCRRDLSLGFPGRLILHLPPAFLPLSDIRDRRYSVCRILSILGLLPDGGLSFCGIGEKAPELVLGSVFDGPLARIWAEASLLRALRRQLPGDLKGICSRCVLKAYCLGECRAEAYETTGDLMGGYWFCQDALEQGWFPRSRLL